MFYLTLPALIFGADHTIKDVVEEKAIEGERKLICNDKIYLTKFHNKGAFLGLGKEKPELLKGISIGMISLCTLIFFLTLGHRGKRLLKFGMGLLLGGAYSNLYDRMLREYVIDYFGFATENEKLESIVFNLSDFCIMIGAAIAAVSFEISR